MDGLGRTFFCNTILSRHPKPARARVTGRGGSTRIAFLTADPLFPDSLTLSSAISRVGREIQRCPAIRPPDRATAHRWVVVGRRLKATNRPPTMTDYGVSDWLSGSRSFSSSGDIFLLVCLAAKEHRARICFLSWGSKFSVLVRSCIMCDESVTHSAWGELTCLLPSSASNVRQPCIGISTKKNTRKTNLPKRDN